MAGCTQTQTGHDGIGNAGNETAWQSKQSVWSVLNKTNTEHWLEINATPSKRNGMQTKEIRNIPWTKM